MSALACTVSPNSCPSGYYCDGTCQPGCGIDADCGSSGPDGGSAATPYCDPVAHSCVECVTTSQCGPSRACNAGHCISTCNPSTQKLCNGTCIALATCCNAADCTAAPVPAACRAPTCATPGGSCTYPTRPGSQVCGTTCCNAINGTCAANCTLTCTNGYADCNGDPSDGCETNLGAAGKKLCNGACISASTCCTSTDCNMPPAPGACYLTGGTCPAPGGTCTYTQKGGSQICNNNTTCCNGINGTCSGTCGLSCTSGFFDCNTNVADGCETACAPANATGKCVGTSGCGIASCNGGFFDCNSSASDGCECGTSCCTNPMTSLQDCMVNTHNDGWGHSFSACYPVGTPGVSGSPGTPGTGYGLQFAQDAAAADTSIVGNCTSDADCQPYASSATCVNGACVWPNAKCFSGQEYIQSLCKYTLAGNGKPSDCTCWAFAASAGTCGSNIPCADAIGHTNHVVSNFCPCVAATNGTYQ
jgi:hypothetical protein